MITGLSIGALILITVIGLVQGLGFHKRKSGALILVAIAFIYVGFAAENMTFLVINSIQAIVFFFFAYFGLTRQWQLIPLGLLLHALWDMGHLLIGPHEMSPPHYEALCILIDVGLAIYFYQSIKHEYNA